MTVIPENGDGVEIRPRIVNRLYGSVLDPKPSSSRVSGCSCDGPSINIVDTRGKTFQGGGEANFPARMSESWKVETSCGPDHELNSSSMQLDGRDKKGV